MILGAVANSMRPASASAADVSSTAPIYLDFTTQTYLMSGVATPLSSILDRTDMTINSNGARFDYNTADLPANFTPSALAAIPASGWTFVIEWLDVDYSGGGFYPFYMEERATEPLDIYLVSGFDYATLYDQALGIDRFFDFYPAPEYNTIPRRMAFTRIIANAAVSFNGGAVTTDSDIADYPPIPDYVSLGGFWMDSYLSTDSWIRKVAFYPPVADGDLPTYSTVA